MKDRFSLHVHDGQSEILEALTVMRNGFTRSQSGLVGVTNVTHAENEQPTLPETIFNVQTTGDSTVRFASVSSSNSVLQLLGNGNTRASGLEISYSPSNDYINFSHLRPSGCAGIESGFMVVTPNNFVGIGTTKFKNSYKFTPNSPLTIWHSGTTNSGTIALKEQQTSPEGTSSFGKIFVKPDIGCSNRQSFFFLDDQGNEFNLSHPTGMVQADSERLNTYAGYQSPISEWLCEENSQLKCNTTYGHAAGWYLTTGDNNTLIGCKAGSGVKFGEKNVVVGANNLTHRNTSNCVIIGTNLISPDDTTEDHQGEYFSNNIIIGQDIEFDTLNNSHGLLIGFGDDPVIQGGLGGDQNRFLAVKSIAGNEAFLAVNDANNSFATKITEKEETTPIGTTNVGQFLFSDNTSALQHKGMASLRFENRFAHKQTLVDFVPSGNVPTTSPSWYLPTYDTPYMAVSGDIRVLGAIRFANGTVLESAQDFQIEATSGVGKRTSATTSSFILDFDELSMAHSLTPSIDTTASYFALEVPSGSSRFVGKFSLDSIAQHITSGYASVANNCNLIFADAGSEVEIDSVNNSGMVFIGCGVGVNSTGWKNGIFLGPEAGVNSVTPNTNLATDTSPVFIGYRAGYDSDSLENTIAIGSNAGKNADASSDSIFIGSNAGLNASGNRNCIGIGEFALDGEETPGHDSLYGNNNIEIVTGLNSNQRLFYASGNVNSRINIQNVIAGNHGRRMISIGDGRLSPQAPLEVRRDVGLTGHADTDNIQTWQNSDVTVGRVDASGDYIRRDEQGSDAWFGQYEGFMVDYIYAPDSYTAPKSGVMRTRTYKNGFAADKLIWVTNRDTKLDIHGEGATGGAAFVVTNRVNGENRPIYVSCSGDGS